jgi:hypothetical protein
MCRSARSTGPSRVSNVYPIGLYNGQAQPITRSAGNLRNRLDAVAAQDFMYGLTFQLRGTLSGAAGVGLGEVRSYLDFVGAR